MLALDMLLAVGRIRPSTVMKIAPASTRQRNGRNGVFEDQLLLRSGFQNYRILVKAFDSTRKLDSAHQVNRNVASFFTGTVEKAVLYCVLLLWCLFHLLNSPSKKLSGYLKINTLNWLGQEYALLWFISDGGINGIQKGLQPFALVML